MAKKLSYEERFERFKKKIRDSATQGFFGLYQEMKEIERGLIEEKKVQLYSDGFEVTMKIGAELERKKVLDTQTNDKAKEVNDG